MKKGSSKLIAIGAALWCACIALGLGSLWSYESKPGAASPPPMAWPAESRMTPASSDQLQLVMFVHPHCPCTRASVGELALLMANCQGRLQAQVLFIKPANMPEKWEETDLWTSVTAIPSVKAICDEGGVEARRFGAHTSGHCVLYDKDKHVLFAGGITSARAHSGDNAGRSAITALVHQQPVTTASTPVFGCSLFDRDECSNLGDTSCCQ
jgi:hypothetical protein